MATGPDKGKEREKPGFAKMEAIPGLAERPPAGEAKREARHHDGHRDRLRERFSEAGADALADYELLELILFRTIPRRDVKPIAKALIARFGSLSEVLGAPRRLLTEVPGVKDAVALDLTIVAAINRRAMREAVRKREVLSSWAAVLDYITAAMAHEPREQFRILFLDKKNALIADEVQGTGTVDHTPVYPREVVKRALELNATALILVHKLPTLTPQASPHRPGAQLCRKPPTGTAFRAPRRRSQGSPASVLHSGRSHHSPPPCGRAERRFHAATRPA